ncbi:MAG: Rpn family recombination-promoting nuclease/putative transposase [Synechococcaceae cyanobacterium SM2_3_2]|nr:Rpn family recombination-promoting nuclease/putative transposase [Synechococcaceae cyanobacterium SM2_3_2]
MKTDSIFYRLFKDFPSLLFELLGQDPYLAAGYEFSSREVKELAFRLDGIFLSSDTDQPIYFVEVQFQKDPSLYYRVVAEMAMYLRQHEPIQPCQVVVLYPRKSLDPGIPASLGMFATSIQRVYLNQLPDTESPLVEIVKLIVDSPRRARERVQGLVSRGLESGILELLETVLVYKFAELSRGEIEAMFGLSELKQTRVYQEAREEGKQEGEVNLTLRLLRRKFSLEALPNKTEATIRSLPIEKLERLGEELLTFTSIENLISWLDQFAPDSP